MLLYRKIDHPEDYVALQMDINSVNNWIKGNYLTITASKCKYMLILRRRQHPCDPPELLLDNFNLERVECFKYLGILLNSDLSWSNHITSICTKARKLLGLLYRRFINMQNHQHYFNFISRWYDPTWNTQVMYWTPTHWKCSEVWFKDLCQTVGSWIWWTYVQLWCLYTSNLSSSGTQTLHHVQNCA